MNERYHVVGEFTQYIFIRHNELFGRVSVGNVSQNAECLFLHVGTMFAFQYENDSL